MFRDGKSDMAEVRSEVDTQQAQALLDSQNMFSESQEIRIHPYKLYEAARTIGTIAREPHTGVYVVSRYRDLLEVERRHADFSACVSSIGPYAIGHVPERPDEAKCPFGEADLDDELTQWRETTELSLIPVLTLDPPVHTDFRSLVNKLFDPKRKEKITPNLIKYANDLIDLFIEKGKTDWVSTYSMPYTYFTMNEVMDFPRVDEELMFKEFAKRQHDRGNRATVDGTGPRQADPDNPVAVSQERFLEYLSERRENPKDDVLSEIATARFADGSLPDLKDLTGIASVMYGAGQGTTKDLIGNMMLTLAQRPQLQEHLAAHPDKIENFVAEMLRWDPPVQGLFRFARRDTEVNGVKVPAGSVLWMCYAAANRDPEMFENPDELDVDRENAYQAISFGCGRHFCPGQPLAKLEAKITFEEVFKRMRNIRLQDSDEDIKYASWFVVRGPNELNIVFDKA